MNKLFASIVALALVSTPGLAGVNQVASSDILAVT
jgi:hypothetical protein